MIEWKDTTSYSRGSKKREPTVWTAHISPYEKECEFFLFAVHRYIGCTDTWHLSCNELDFSMIILKSKEIENAKKEATGIIISKLTYKFNFYSEILKKLSSSS